MLSLDEGIKLLVENLELRRQVLRLQCEKRALQWDKFAIKRLVMRGNHWSDEALFDQLKADFKERLKK